MKGKKTILIIEDEVFLSRVLHDKLVNNGFDVVVAEDGVKGLRKISKGNIDLILLDILMPQMDGMEVLKKLRIENKSKIPVMVLTNLGAENYAELALKNGADDYLIKSNNSLDDILKRINKILKI